MINTNLFKALLTLSFLLGMSSTALAQNCGDAPEAPDVVDGASTTMDLLVANSEEVKSYIASADTFLDCIYDFRDTVVYKDLPRNDKEAVLSMAEDVLEDRNEIGDDFNEEVAAYQAANP